MGTPRVSSLVHGIASLPRPSEDPSVRPKTSPGASRDLESSHSISIGDGAVGPPRSGFVLRVCIRKADQACVKAALHHGLAFTRFCKRRREEPQIERSVVTWTRWRWWTIQRRPIARSRN